MNQFTRNTRPPTIPFIGTIPGAGVKVHFLPTDRETWMRWYEVFEAGFQKWTIEAAGEFIDLQVGDGLAHYAFKKVRNDHEDNPAFYEDMRAAVIALVDDAHGKLLDGTLRELSDRARSEREGVLV